MREIQDKQIGKRGAKTLEHRIGKWSKGIVRNITAYCWKMHEGLQQIKEMIQTWFLSLAIPERHWLVAPRSYCSANFWIFNDILSRTNSRYELKSRHKTATYQNVKHGDGGCWNVARYIQKTLVGTCWIRITCAYGTRLTITYYVQRRNRQQDQVSIVEDVING